MKATLKILGFLFIIAIAITSCETPADGPKYPVPEDPNNSTPIDWTKLHHIRPTKPIRIPDTMAIQTKHAILEHSFDTIIYNPQNPIPEK